MPATPELIVDEAGKILITNTHSVVSDTLLIGGYVVAGVVSLVLIALILAIIQRFGHQPKRTIQERHVYHYKR